MIFTETPLRGAWLIEPERFEDERGYFARTYCREEFEAHGLEPLVEQCSTSYNRARYTLRGLHWQREPHAEDKLVRCTAGAIFDVIVDLRKSSPTYSRWWGVELSAGSGRQVFMSKGFAHGFLTLKSDSMVAYQMSVPFAPGHGAGLRYDDSKIAIDWPAEPAVIAAKDLELPTLLQLEAENAGGAVRKSMEAPDE